MSIHFLSDYLLDLDNLFPEHIRDLVTACPKSQFYPITDLLSFIQRVAVDRYLAHVRIGEHDPGQCVERIDDFDDKTPPFVNASRRAVTRPGLLE